ELAAIRRLIEAVALDHRPHRSVDDNDSLFENAAKFVRAVGLRHRVSEKAKAPRIAGPTRFDADDCRLFSFFYPGCKRPRKSLQVTSTVPRREARNPAADERQGHRGHRGIASEWHSVRVA